MAGRIRPSAAENYRAGPEYERRPIDGRGAIDISMPLLIFSLAGRIDAN